MYNLEFGGNLPVNNDQKCPVVLVLDTSGSMNGEPIMELNRGLKAFEETTKKHETASQRVEVAVVSFGSNAKVEHDFAHIQNFKAPTLYASGLTEMAKGMNKAFELIEQQKEKYKKTGEPYYRPMIILMTDGEPYPDGEQQIDEMKDKIHNGSKEKHFKFWAFGVQKARMDILNKIAYSPTDTNDSSRSMVLKLSGIDFTEFFEWLSASLEKISGSKEGEPVDFTPDKNHNPFQQIVS